MLDKEIHRICIKYGIKNYIIYNGLVNVNGNVDLFAKKLSKLPLKFGIVSGFFNCSYNELVSLDGSPREVGESFYCHKNNLTSLMGSPLKVGGDFYCHSNAKELSYKKHLLKMERLNKLKQLDVG